MPEDNENLIRSGYERFNEGEKDPADDLWHADSEYVNSSDDPDPADRIEALEAAGLSE